MNKIKVTLTEEDAKKRRAINERLKRRGAKRRAPLPPPRAAPADAARCAGPTGWRAFSETFPRP